jgi:hypothetical protein
MFVAVDVIRSNASGKIKSVIAMPMGKNSVAPIDKLRERLVIDSIDCSPDGRWIVAKYLLYEEGDSSKCRKSLPKIVLWEANESRRYEVGQGYWDFWWAPNGLLLINSNAPACESERGQQTRFQLPPPAKDIRAAMTRNVIRRALGSNSGVNEASA